MSVSTEVDVFSEVCLQFILENKTWKRDGSFIVYKIIYTHISCTCIINFS